MDKQRVYEFNSSSAHTTEQLAEQIGQQLKGGEIIELAGDIGAGKTTFVRGLARGIGSIDRVSSPTFTVSKTYHSDRISLHHYDFYRLDDLKIIKNDLAEKVADSKNSVVLEWANEVGDVFDKDNMRVKFSVSSGESRDLVFKLPVGYEHIRIKQ